MGVCSSLLQHEFLWQVFGDNYTWLFEKSIGTICPFTYYLFRILQRVLPSVFWQFQNAFNVVLILVFTRLRVFWRIRVETVRIIFTNFIILTVEIYWTRLSRGVETTFWIYHQNFRLRIAYGGLKILYFTWLIIFQYNPWYFYLFLLFFTFLIFKFSDILLIFLVSNFVNKVLAVLYFFYYILLSFFLW